MVRVMMEVMMLVAVDDEDGVQWRQGGGHSMAVASLDGGYATTSQRSTRG